jgi:hypothetical protein
LYSNVGAARQELETALLTMIAEARTSLVHLSQAENRILEIVNRSAS